ncbi:unnamed protein product [Durusdinium trenchii]|uniref:Ion transport domain-containing protein n=1 Tax=Durusdinium trenchii TaxID=1381693 RepID=A0ABP0N1I6_9DINO
MANFSEGGELRALLEKQHQELLRRLDVQDVLLSEMRRSWALPKDVPNGLASEMSLENYKPRRASVTSAAEAAQAEAAKKVPQSPQTEDIQKFRRDPSMRSAKKGEESSCLSKLVKHRLFESFFGVVVLTNAIFIGIDVDLSARETSRPMALRVMQYIYAVLFTSELLLRLCAAGGHFLRTEDWAWNLLDVLVVLSSLWDVAVDIISIVGTTSVESIAGVSSLKSFRIIRLTRLLRTVQFVRIFRFVIALRTLVTSILHTMKALVWALFLLLLIVYVFAVLFTQVISDYFENGGHMTGPELDAAQRYFGSLTDSVLALCLSISNGVSWELVLMPIKKLGTVWVLCFLGYMSFTYFCVLNVVTAVFCQSAIESAQNDQITMMQAMLMNKEQHLQKIQLLFEQLGSDDSEVITLKIFEENINSPEVRAYFEALGLDVWDAWSFFKLLDSDGGGSVDVEEFFMGCLRFRGSAKAMDVGKVIQDQASLMKHQSRFQKIMEVELRRLQLQLSELQTSLHRDGGSVRPLSFEDEDAAVWSPLRWTGSE